MNKFPFYRLFLYGSMIALAAVIACIFYLVVVRTRQPASSKYSLPAANTTRLTPGAEKPFSHPSLARPDSLFAAGNFEDAGYHYGKAAEFFRTTENWKGYVWALNQQGYSSIKNNQLPDAYKILTTASETGRSKLGETHSYVGHSDYMMGEYYYALSEPEPALKALRRALHSAELSSGRRSKPVVDAYKLMGRVYWSLVFDYNMAEKYLDTVFMLYDESKERDTSFLYSLYYDMAATNYYKGDYDKGMIYADGCLKMAESIQNLSYMEKAHGLLSNFFAAKSDTEKNIYHLKMAVTLNKKSKFKTDLVNYYNNLGNAYLDIHSYDEAKRYFQHAGKIILQHGNADSLEVSNNLAAMGHIYQLLNNFDSSLYYYQRSLDVRLAHFGKEHVKTAALYQSIGSLFHQHEQLDSALKYYQQALLADVPGLSEVGAGARLSMATIGYRYYLFETIGDRAYALQQQYYTHKKPAALYEALAGYRLADTLMHLYARSYDQEGSKLLLSAKFQRVYENALECVFLLSRVTNNDSLHRQAFSFMERSKNQLLLQGLRRAESFHATGVPDSLIVEEKRLQTESDRYQQQLERAVDSAGESISATKNIRSALFEIEKKQERLKRLLQQDYPAFFEFKYTDESVSLDEVRAKTKQDHSQTIEFFWGDSALYLMSIKESGSRFLQVQRTTMLNQVFNEFVREFSLVPGFIPAADQLKHHQENFEQYAERAFFLYTSLLKPVLDSTSHNPGISDPKLVIIPDGPLAYLPFQALVSRLPSPGTIDYRNLAYLLGKYKISTAYSATLLFRKKEKARNVRHAVLAFGYSAIHEQTDPAENNALPGSARELREIREVIGGKFLVGKDATKSNFKKYAAGYNMLHLAIHGDAKGKNQFESRLIFRSQTNDSLDASLYAYELYGLKVNARLVVLSACETGSGKLYSGEGVYSIARGFAYAGCPSMVISLWKVDDNTTADLMHTFYKSLAKGQRIDEALKSAQMKYLQTEDELGCHPKYWAAFVPLGDMSPVKPDYTNIAIASAACAMALLLVLYVLGKRRKI